MSAPTTATPHDLAEMFSDATARVLEDLGPMQATLDAIADAVFWASDNGMAERYQEHAATIRYAMDLIETVGKSVADDL